MEEENKTEHRGFKIFLLIFTIGSLFLLREENQNKIINIINSINYKEGTLELVDSFDIREDILSVNIYEDTIIKWNNNKLSFLDLDGRKILDKEFNFIQPAIYYGKDLIYPMDKARGDIYSIDKRGETIERLELGKEIFNFQEINGNIILHEKLSGIENLTILDKKKNSIGDYSYEDKSILTYSLNKEESKRAIGLIQLDHGEINSLVDVYGKDNESLYSIDIDGELIVYLEFTPKDDIVILTDRGIHFTRDGEILWTRDLNLIRDLYLADEEIYLLYSNYLETMDFRGNIKNKLAFTEEYEKILLFQNTILVYGDKNISIVEDGRVKLTKEEEVKWIGISGDKILLWGPEKIKIYELGI